MVQTSGDRELGEKVTGEVPLQEKRDYIRALKRHTKEHGPPDLAIWEFTKGVMVSGYIRPSLLLGLMSACAEKLTQMGINPQDLVESKPTINPV
jgi:hypothetical protein